MQPNSCTTSKKMSVVVTLTFALCIPLFNTTKNIELVTLPKYLTPEKYDKSWYGLIKCKVVPPRKLYHPVLPQRIKVNSNEKLVFTLCKTCAETRSQSKCDHTDAKRSFIGTWTTDEVNKAIEKGYQVLRTYEVWHFDKSTDALFKGYIRRFMKIKLESSN